MAQLPNTVWWDVQDAHIGRLTDDGIEDMQPLPQMAYGVLTPAIDPVKVNADVQRLISSTVSLTIKLTPAQAWDLRCLLKGWKTEFTRREGWNRRIWGEA